MLEGVQHSTYNGARIQRVLEIIMGTTRYIVNLEAAIFKDDQYLMAMRSRQEAHAGGTLGFVGGTSEPEDEQHPDVMTAWLRREIREEVGVEVDELHYVTSVVFQTAAGEPVLNVVFLCAYKSGEPRAVDPREVEWVQWMTADEALQHEGLPTWSRDYLQACERVRQKLTV